MVERLLRERTDDSLEHIRVYLDARPEIYDWLRPGIFRILDLKALSHVGNTYKMRVRFEDRLSRTTKTYVYPKIRVLDILLELDGDRFEIVGHETPGQLAAPPGQPEATDAVLSQEGGTAVAPEQDEPSLDAVERLLSERSEEFREKLRVYNNEVGFEPLAHESWWAFKLWEIQVLGIENGAYKVRALIEAKGRGGLKVLVGAVEVIVLLKVEGNDFEIVGHEDASG